MSPLALMFPLAVIFVNSNSPASILLPVPSFFVTLVEKLPLSIFRFVTLVEKLALSANKFVPKIFPLELISDDLKYISQTITQELEPHILICSTLDLSILQY